MKKYIYKLIFIIVFGIVSQVNVFSQSTDLLFTMQFQNASVHQAVIYPNPVLDNKFKVKSEQIISSVEVINVIGKTVYQYVNKTYSTGDVFINTEDCEKGMYLIKITFDDDEYIIKKMLIK